MKMPINRDISVQGSGDPIESEEGAELARSRSEPGCVTVTGFGKDDVLFRSSRANTIQVRDSSGVIIAMLIRMKNDVWGFSRRGDSDWEQVLAIYANPDNK